MCEYINHYRLTPNLQFLTNITMFILGFVLNIFMIYLSGREMAMIIFQQFSCLKNLILYIDYLIVSVVRAPCRNTLLNLFIFHPPPLYILIHM